MKWIKPRLLVVAVLVLVVGSSPAWAQQWAPYLYRLAAADHLFTVDNNEAWWHQVNLGYVSESVEALVWNAGGSGMKPVYRLSRSVGGHLHHYYTSNESEKNYLLQYAQNTGYSLDGIGFYLRSTQVQGTYPVYRIDRVYKPAQWFLWWQISPEVTADSVLTMRNSEVSNAINNLGYYTNNSWGYIVGYAQPGWNGVN